MRQETRLKLIAAITAAFFILTFACAAALAKEDTLTAFALSAPSLAGELGIEADGAVLIESKTLLTLAGENAHARLPMASTTKIMTALIVIEHSDMDEMVETPKEAYGVEGSSMYLGMGEKLSVRDMLYGLMLVSGNDAAIALAIHVAGSVENFANIMNARARELGAVNTNFVTPNGLPDDSHYTSAYDLALISAKAMEYEAFRKLVSTSYHKTTTGSVARTLKNKNKLLFEYEGGCGIKTGYTKAAGKCLAFAAERDGMLLIGVVLNCRDMFGAAKKLLDYGFSHYRMERIVVQGNEIARVKIENGEINSLALIAKDDIMIPVEINRATEYETKVTAPRTVEAPKKAGSDAGYVDIIHEGRVIASSRLVLASDAPRRKYVRHLRSAIAYWTP